MAAAEIADAAASPAGCRPGPSIARKLLALLLLVVAADALSDAGAAWSPGGWAIGAGIGLFALLLLATLLVLTPAIRRSRPARAAAALAFAAALVLCLDPGRVFGAIYGLAVATMVLLPRVRGFDDVLRWAARLFAFGLTVPVGPLVDAARLCAHRKRAGLAGLVGVLAWPAGGCLVFLGLFAQANPLIADALDIVGSEGAFAFVTLPRAAFWLATLPLFWSLLRPFRLRLTGGARAMTEARMLPGINPASVLLSLVLFNALFAVQNALDIAFLWSGAPLPAGLTLAGYAHRGAYPLIATALLAAVFVLLALRPGTPTARDRRIRFLLMLWIGQNLLLVASSMLRTLDYVEAYSLTVLRLAALAWMVLVATGLLLVCWRVLAGRSAAWLVNANAVAALAVVAGLTLADPAAVVAEWNLSHTSLAEAQPVDLHYLTRLGPAALVPMAVAASAAPDPHLRFLLRAQAVAGRGELAALQADWRLWTPRNAWRLARLDALLTQAPER